VERVKINFGFSFEREGKGPESLGKMRGNKFQESDYGRGMKGENSPCERLPRLARYLA
jgi:hypothetical protein